MIGADFLILSVVVLLNPIIWGFFHIVLTEAISVSLLFIYAFYAIKFFAVRRNGLVKRRQYIIYIVLSCVFVVICWFLKQSFFTNVVLIAGMFELLYFCHQPKVKKALYSIVLLISMAFTIKGSINVWYGIINEDGNRYASGMANEIVNLRYFYQEYDIAQNVTRISVRDDGYEEIDSFEYTFDSTLTNRLTYLWICFKNYPDRVIQGYIDNYLLMADVYQNPRNADGTYDITFAPVIRNHPVQTILGQYESNVANEFRTIALNRLRNEIDYANVFEDQKELLNSVDSSTEMLGAYEYISKPGLISKLLGSNLVWNGSQWLYSILIILNPFIFLGSLFLYFKHKDRDYFAIVTTLSFYSLGMTTMHVLVGRPIDRYALPSYAMLLLITCFFIVDCCIRIGLKRRSGVTYAEKEILQDGKQTVKEMKTLVIIPAYNEADNIGAVLKNLTEYAPEMDYLVVNDCSIDKTVEILKEYNANYVDLPVNLGIGGGVQTGYLYAYKNGYDIAIQMDGDGQHDAKFLKALIKPIQDGQADVVIGSRYILKEGFQSSFMRRVGIKGLSILIKLTTGINVNDVTSGFRAINKDMIALFAHEYAQDYPEPEAIVMAVCHGAKVVEVPVRMNERAGGKSSISGLKSIYYMVKVSLSIMLLRISLGGKNK
jgi:hypothetical protein